REPAERDEEAQHEDVAVGEVDQLDDAVHHRVAEGDQREDGATGETVDRLLDENLPPLHLSGGARHGPPLPPGRLVTPRRSRGAPRHSACPGGARHGPPPPPGRLVAPPRGRGAPRRSAGAGGPRPGRPPPPRAPLPPP